MSFKIFLKKRTILINKTQIVLQSFLKFCSLLIVIFKNSKRWALLKKFNQILK